MKAIIKNSVSNAVNYSREKETVSKYIVIGKINGELREVVDCRVYMGRSRNASTVYASLWVHAGNLCTSGRGTAGGYGYHKESAAIASAIDSASIELWGSPYANRSTWNYDEKREYTPAEMRAMERKDNKRRAHIGGRGDESARAALMAIAKAAGARGKLIFVSM